MWYNLAMSKKSDKIIGIVSWSLVVLLAVSVFLWIILNKKEDNTVQLNISASRDLTGVIVSTNDGSSLTGCKLTINNKYSDRIRTIDAEYRTYEYSNFTDNENVSFDINKTEPKELFINDCQNNSNGIAAFSW